MKKASLLDSLDWAADMELIKTNMGSSDSHYILMPDVKLLGAASSSLALRLGWLTPVVSWLVDDVTALLKALEMGVSGVVSNKPVELLGALTELHKRHCNVL